MRTERREKLREQTYIRVQKDHWFFALRPEAIAVMSGGAHMTTNGKAFTKNAKPPCTDSGTSRAIETIEGT
jgi:hypothetical protein